MRQVPHYLLIGNGRLAKHFRHYFSELSLTFETWHRQEPVAQLQEKIHRATHILLLISDNAIDDFCHEHLHESSAIKIHCSGSLNSEYAYGAHPLMTFSHDLYVCDRYQSIPFIIDADAPAFSELLPGLENPHSCLDKSLKAKYHALCVMSGNFSCLLWQKLLRDFKDELEIPPEFAHQYMQQQTQNLLSNPEQALTGPLVRNDLQTIKNNLAALAGDPFQLIYQQFVSYYQEGENV